MDPSIVHCHTHGRFDETLLHLAAKYDRADLVEILIAHKIDLNVRDSRGRSAYHAAAWFGATSALNVLISADGTHIDDIDNYNRTPLIWAAVCGRVECVKLLLLHKSDFRLEDNRGRTALDHARMDEHVEVIKLLEDV